MVDLDKTGPLIGSDDFLCDRTGVAEARVSVLQAFLFGKAKSL